MTKAEKVRRIKDTISKLNTADNRVVFFLKEDTNTVSIDCVSEADERTHFGTYYCMEFFEDYKDPGKAYDAVLKFVEGLLAGTRLNDPKAYHNMIAERRAG